MGLDFLTPLERRQFLSVSAQIRLLNNDDIIQVGQSVHVNALPTASGEGTDFGRGAAFTSKFEWDFGDKGGSFNKLPGFNAAHVYDRPGEYVVTLRVTNDRGESDVATRTIQVKRDARRKIYVNPWGNDSNNGRTPDTAVASLQRAQEMLGDNTGIYFRNGMEWTTKKSFSIPFSNVEIGAYGKGKAPNIILKRSDRKFPVLFGIGDKSRHVTIENLQLSAQGGSGAFGEAIHPGGSNIVIKGVRFHNFQSAIMETRAPEGLLVMNNIAGPLKSYFAYVRGSDQVFAGNIVGDSTAEHNIRIYGSRILCYGNDLTNLPKGKSLATLRVNDGGKIYWANNILRAGQMVVGPLGPESAGSSPDQFVDSVVIEGNRWLEVPEYWSVHDRIDLNPGTANVMIRDNYLEATNSSAISAATRARPKFGGRTITRTLRDVRILSNKVVNSGTRGAFLNVNGGTTNVLTVKNCLYVAPDMEIGPYSSAAIRVLGRSDLGNFTAVSSGGGITGNVWNLPQGAWSQGVHYVSDEPAGSSAYRTPTEWKQFSVQVQDDHFERVLARQLDANGNPLPGSKASLHLKV